MTHRLFHSPAPSHRMNFKVMAMALVMTLLFAACGGDFGSVDSVTDAASDTSSFDRADAAMEVEDGGFAMAVEDAMDDEADGDFGRTTSALAEGESLGADLAANQQVTTSGAAGSGQVTPLPDLGRDIIFNARLELASTDVSTATRNAITAIEGRGGFLFSQETNGGSGGSSLLTFKVLPEQFQAALNDLGTIGEVRSQSISADDVSAVVVDLESRINTAEASVIRLRDLLDGASELETIATLENQLLQRETTLEQLRGQLRSVRKQVDLATITVFVTELTNRPALRVEVVSYAGHDAGFSCFDAPGRFSGEVGDPLTLCYQLINSGDTPLVDISFDDPALGATLSDMVVVDGDVTQIDPGESLLLAHEIELEEPVRVRTAVTATALDADGNPIEDEVRTTAPTLRFSVTNIDDGFPGFGEVLGNSWNALVTVAVVAALVAVAIAPFLVVGLLLGLPVWHLIRRRRAGKPVMSETGAPVPTEPRPAPPAPSSAATEANGPGDAPDEASETSVDA